MYVKLCYIEIAWKSAQDVSLTATLPMIKQKYSEIIRCTTPQVKSKFVISAQTNTYIGAVAAILRNYFTAYVRTYSST